MTMRDGIGTTAHHGSSPNRDAPAMDVPFSVRMWARLFAGRYDRQIDDGVHVEAGSPLAAHCARLASRRERRGLAQALTNVLYDAGLSADGSGPTRRVPIRVEAVRDSSDLVADVLARLIGPLPVRVRGMARLRILLADGRSPVYTPGPGTFAAAVRGVLAAM